ncbi:anthranilate synthase component I family protein [uncultured Hyphomonas sp.]|uniref:anthranilate synthase component I family protein n=1 Tax=uncultured Hyphomonas sp. TaxID=225298 RepID=UPI002AAB29EA|nr:anthranilate synthase component I family protein [uncultured Hyphomonas sp.]
MEHQDLPWKDPAEIAGILHRLPGFVWLDSAGGGHVSGRYSYMAATPISGFCWPQADANAGFEAQFRAWMDGFQARTVEGGSPFQGGVIGYLSYDAASIWIRDFQSRHPPSLTETVAFALYDTVLAFDHLNRTLSIYSAGLSIAGVPPDRRLARERIATLTEMLNAAPPTEPETSPCGDDWAPAPHQTDYAELVARVQNAIRDGEVYQANIASLWTHPLGESNTSFRDYLRLRAQTEAPFSAFGAFGARTLSSLSPERLVTMDRDGRVRAEPIKGTARRATDPEQDREIADTLAGSEKDRAENIMIVDLMRNDLSRVCLPESVTVADLCRVETLPNLHHLVSSVDGQMEPGRDAIDLLAAVFPGGSVTGAPKSRAMEIIDEFEPAARGAFCGALGYIGFDGACDFNIMIRTIEYLPSGARYWSGAGLTLLSEPAAEWAEVQLKAERILSTYPAPS